jgi:hypothetical protein
MFAQLMGLKTISPDALHALLQGQGAVTVFDLNSRRSWESARVQCLCDVGGNQRLACRETAHRIRSPQLNKVPQRITRAGCMRTSRGSAQAACRFPSIVAMC